MIIKLEHNKFIIKSFTNYFPAQYFYEKSRQTKTRTQKKKSKRNLKHLKH